LTRRSGVAGAEVDWPIRLEVARHSVAASNASANFAFTVISLSAPFCASKSRQNWSAFARPPYFPARSDRPLARSQKRNFCKALVLYYLAHAQAD
jgi:hypothetical protein